MTIDVTDMSGNPDEECFIDIKFNEDCLISVDAHNGDPPTVTVYESSRQEDAFATFQFDSDGNIDSLNI